MPLFMAVSGFLLQQTLNHRTEWEVALIRLYQLGIPILSFGVLAFAIKWVVYPNYDAVECLKELFHTCTGNLWFLWALLYNQVLLLLIHRMGDKIWIYVVVGTLIYFIPDSNYIPTRYTFLYPFLVMGYMMSKYSFNKLFVYKRWMTISASMLLLYIGGLYASCTLLNDIWEWSMVGNILHTVMRQLIALLALGWILPLLYELHKAFTTKRIVRLVADAGQNSLGIYYFQTLIFILVSRICHLLPSLGVWGAIIGGVVITTECLLLARWSKAHRITRLLIWGGK